MDSYASKALYLQRRKQLIEQIGSGIVVLMGNEEVGMNYTANAYPFRQDSSFLYFIGMNQPNLVAIIDIDAYKTYLFGNDFTMDDLIWMGNQTSLKESAAEVGIHNVDEPHRIASRLSHALQQHRTVYFLPPYRLRNAQKLSAWLGIPITEIAQHASQKLVKAVIAQRSIKTTEEIAEMEKALHQSKIIHETLMQRAKAGMKESTLVGIAQGIALAMEGSLAYPPIVTVHGQVLHNHYYGNTLQSGQLLLMDIGAATGNQYASDITRTLPVAGTFSTFQKEIYDIVLQANSAVIEQLKPHIAYRDMHFLAVKTIVEGLVALGLMKGDADEAVAAGAHALFMPHGLGHMIGLDVHDMEDLGEDQVGYEEHQQRSEQFGTAYLRLAKTLLPGYTLTVEPGIYFIPQLIDQWQQQLKFTHFIDYAHLEQYRTFGGIRIEDNILITQQGCRVLGQPIAKTVADVEALSNN
ncbi:MAG: aminopeptidase P family protein [Saprospiraceae bacterium]|nr:aminopeptidase P family protein [Saprospiraceae bacterium]